MKFLAGAIVLRTKLDVKERDRESESFFYGTSKVK